MQNDSTIPAGLCQCGCGSPTTLVARTDKWNKKGEYRRYVRGHGRRQPDQYKVEDRGFSSPCWVWQGSIKPDGYACKRVPGGEKVGVHRTYYVRFKGQIPAGYEVDHLCRVRHCVNPDHLEAVTPKENSLRSKSPAAKNARKSHCKRGHEFTPENTFKTPSRPNERGCRACRKARHGAGFVALKERLDGVFA